MARALKQRISLEKATVTLTQLAFGDEDYEPLDYVGTVESGGLRVSWRWSPADLEAARVVVGGQVERREWLPDSSMWISYETSGSPLFPEPAILLAWEREERDDPDGTVYLPMPVARAIVPWETLLTTGEEA